MEKRLVVAEDNIKAMATATGANQPVADDDEEEPDVEAKPSTVHAAVESAAALCPYLEFLAEAFSSARDSGYPHPQRVLDDLLALNNVARAWVQGDLPAGGFEPALVAEGISGYRSASASQPGRSTPPTTSAPTWAKGSPWGRTSPEESERQPSS